MVDWATKSNLALLHNPKDDLSFFPGRCNIGTNPDLAFISNGQLANGVDRRILEKFHKSQHRSSLIKSSKTVVSLPSEPYKRYNFQKGKWKKYMRITNRLARDLHLWTLPVLMRPTNTSATLLSTQRKNQFHTVIGKTTDYAGMRSVRSLNTVASALLARLDKRRRKRLSKTFNAIDFRQFSPLAWNAINNLTGRTIQSYCLCPISASSIASQLVKNGTYKTNDREFTRLVFKEVSELCRISTPAGKCISGDFSPKEFARSHQLLQPGKALGPDSICSELIIHAGAALKSWLNNFLSSCMCQLKLPKI